MDERELMLTLVLDCRRIDLYAEELKLSRDQKKRFKDMRDRRRGGEPVQYITGQTEFCGLAFLINSRVLIPRPETELMVDHVINALKGKHSPLRILEIGTGSGCIAVSLVKHLARSCCHAVDISSRALEVAVHNARRHRVDDRMMFTHVDALQDWERIFTDRYDLVISNPPYILRSDLSKLPEDVRREPRLALDGGIDGLTFYRHFVRQAPRVLSSDGLLVCEFGDGQDQAIHGMLNGSWSSEFFKDLSGVKRFFVAQYCPSFKGGLPCRN